MTVRRKPLLRRVFVALMAFALLTSLASAQPAASKAKAKAKATKKKAKTTKKAVIVPKKSDFKAPSANQSRQKGSGPSATTPASQNVRPKDWDPDGELTIAFPAGTNTLDPAGTTIGTYQHPVYDTLTEIDDNFNVKPRLATAWSFPDNKTLMMTLRTDATFHDGTPFDAAAAALNLNRLRTLSTSVVKASLAGISSVEVVNPNTIKINITRGGLELPALFSQQAGMEVSPAAIKSGKSLADGAGGSGPYMVDSFKSLESVTYVPAPNYWNKKEGLLKKLTVLGVTTGPQRLNAVLSGAADLAHVQSADVPQAKAALKAGQLKEAVDYTLTATQNGILLRDTRPPLDNLKIRQAIAYAIDKKSISNDIYQGTCTDATQFFGDQHWAHAPNIDKMYPYDPEKAAQLVRDSGVTNPTITMDYTVASYGLIATAVQSQLKAVGITLNLSVPPVGDTGFRDGTHDAQVTSITGIFDPSQLVSLYLTGIYKLYNDSDGLVSVLAAKGADPSGNQSTWAPAYQQIWEKAYSRVDLISVCNPHQMYISNGKAVGVADMKYKFAGLPDYSALYVKK